jgi:hypothetical protein
MDVAFHLLLSNKAILQKKVSDFKMNELTENRENYFLLSFTVFILFTQCNYGGDELDIQVM